ncbi:hypothetical protein J5751_03755 [bacterium]|nr:hypothetical protein [bacterium]
MEEEDNEDLNVPFPQANDFEKIIKLIKIEDEALLQDNNYLVSILNVSQRQINYYIAACVFLGVVDNKRLFTEFGCLLRKKGYDNFLSSISAKIISMPVFGDAFFSRFFYDEELSTDDIAELLSITYGIENQAVAKRRASTVKNWINWLFKQRRLLF